LQFRCGRCKEVKDCTEFNKNKKTRSGYQNRCKLCRKNHRDANKEHTKKRHAKYYIKNRDAVLGKVRTYKKAHRKELAAAQRKYVLSDPNYKERQKIYRKNILNHTRQYFRKKRKEDINFKLAKNVRSRIRMALISKTKHGKSLQLLGCSIVEYRKYIESKFYTSSNGIEMSWENFGYGIGKWQIDHIVELSTFNLLNVEQQKVACNYLNTQPLWYEDHLKKTYDFLKMRKQNLEKREASYGF